MDALASIKKRVRNYLLAALGTLGLICVTSVQAGIYPFLIGVGGPGFGPDGPNEENFYYEPDGQFVAKVFQEVDYIDLLFYVGGEPNGLPYIETGIYEAIYNETGITWTDYHLELGYAGNITEVDDDIDECETISLLGCISYDFLSPTAEDMGMYFTEADSEPFAEISGMPEEYPNMIWFDDGTVPSGEGFEAYAHYVLPYPGAEGIPEEAYTEGGYFAVLRQTPSIAAVPAPAAIWLFGIGLLGLGFARRRKA